ncbi:Uncharacterized protein BM_BM17572 [Brugia malayi]|uniref:C2H2-type domain-containing protein n=1 Tax=Brugia malayi TaxID=6279 RepID=A0A4E9FDJ7_BRUMA|nr:Uncharacterized protein BM_BM17572 [Brugia malayi]VIO94971.1 Uncharacterized protein BM_BM17572 [Brugia malayi]
MEREDEEEIGLQVFQTKPLDLSAPRMEKEGDESQGLSVEGVSDKRIESRRQLVPIETLVEVVELSKQEEKTRKKHLCNMCGKEVINMKEHMMTHTGKKLYSCPTCGKDFARSNSMKRHMIVHTVSHGNS